MDPFATNVSYVNIVNIGIIRGGWATRNGLSQMPIGQTMVVEVSAPRQASNDQVHVSDDVEGGEDVLTVGLSKKEHEVV